VLRLGCDPEEKSTHTQCEDGRFGGVEEEIVNSGPILSIGSAGPDVRRLQIIFVMTKVLNVSDIDSQFGPKTQDAVKSFQQGNNLTPDGVVGPLTWQALPADPNTPRLARANVGGKEIPDKTGVGRGRNQPCVPIKLGKASQSTELLATRPGGLLQVQLGPRWQSWPALSLRNQVALNQCAHVGVYGFPNCRGRSRRERVTGTDRQ
jgi:peptidoglycan hydrolase-like protein with peptidoglycan-binding domain